MTTIQRTLSLLVGFILVCIFLTPIAFAQQDLTGSWKGELDVGLQKLPLIFHFQPDGDGWKTTMDSPSQQAKDIPVSKVLYDGQLLTMEMKQLQAAFEGIYQGDAFQGQFMQAGLSLPLSLVKIEMTKEETIELNRPQEPIGPFPYEIIQTTFINGPEGFALKGTITKPSGQGPFPAVVLVSGSGPQNRDSEIFGHKPFWVLADYLTRKGIVVLRYDERGVGESEGTFKGITSYDFASDSHAAMQRLQGYEFVQKDKIGIMGHSEGGLIAWILGAAGSELPNFLVALAPPVVPINELMAQQAFDVIIASSGDEDLAREQSEYNRELFKVVKNSPDEEKAKAAMASFVEMKGKEMGLSGDELTKHIEQQVSAYQQLLDPWFFVFIKTEPSQMIEKISVPVWAGFGGKDTQVNASLNHRALEDLSGNSTGRIIKTYPNLNHLFQTSTTGAVSEYGEIEETFSPKVMEDIGAWINELD
ncbi:alpha/beta fold hydrolase [Lunatibacter salilacus]|uniref:alpha/beta fold hydrolase n=1 Tax=Lunatibacter salilacus TaxID=2483804 RepID=UPI00131C69F0|nr:alpha/beta hydrolase [Lunatibacter salilacus]